MTNATKELTPRMIRIEKNFDKDIRSLITELTFHHGMTRTAEIMGIRRTSLENYIKRLKMHVVCVAIPKGHIVEIKRAGY